jgi:hypothetical protein
MDEKTAAEILGKLDLIRLSIDEMRDNIRNP